MPKRALFVISIYNYHREVEPVVRRFLKEGWAVDVLLGWRGEAAQVALEAYETYGAHVIHAPQEMCYGFDELVPSNGAEEVDVETQPVFASRKPSVVERIKGFLRQFGLLYFVQNVRSHLKQIENIKLYVETQLDISGYDAAFQGPFHSVGKLDNVVYCALKTQKTPNYCYPVSAYHGRMNAIMARRDNIELGMVSSELFKDHNYINRIFARLFPYWVADFMGKSFFLSDLSLMFASWIKKVELEDVWAKPQPGFRQIFVYSEFSRSFLEDGQFPMEKTVVCGIPLLDESIERLKNEYESKKLFTYLGLEEDEPFVLFNVEPSYEHHYCDKETHWKRFNELMETVTSVGYPVVLSLHPLCRYEDYSFATDKYAVKISTEYKIHDLYPYCALSVSFACSTNILAEIFHKRVIIYDFFNMTQPDSPRAIEFRLPFAEFCYSTEELKEKLSGLCLKSQSLIGTEFLTETATGIIFETVNQNDKELEI